MKPTIVTLTSGDENQKTVATKSKGSKGK